MTRHRSTPLCLRRQLAACGLMLLSLSCSKSSDSGGTPTGATPAITLSASASSLDVTQGATTNVTITVSRTGGFAGDVVVTVEGLPAGVTASALTITAGSTSGTVTLTAAASTVVAPASVTIRGTGSGVTSATASLTLNVRAAASTGAVTVTFNPTTLNIAQGQTVNLTATITRTGGFTGPVTLDVQGLPTGLTVVITGTASTAATVVTGGSAVLAFTASPTATITSSSVTVLATGAGVTAASITLSTTVSASAAANVTWTFCTSYIIPSFVAVQDGTAAFARVGAGANNSYTFTINSGKGAVAYAAQVDVDSYDLFVFYGTTAELQAQGSAICASQTTGTKTVTGSVAGAAGNDFVSIGLGTAETSLQASSGLNFTLQQIPDGALDLLASKTTVTINGSISTGTLSRIFARRGVNPANLSVLAPIDFNGSEAFDPVFNTLTINNLAGDPGVLSNYYFSGTNTFVPLTFIFSGNAGSTATTRTFGGLPASKQATGDFNSLTLTAQNGTPITGTRTVSTTFHAAADKVLTVGPVALVPTVSILQSSAPSRVRATLTRQPEYSQSFALVLQQGGGAPRLVELSYSAGYVGSGAFNMDVPDLSPAGYSPGLGLQPGVLINWTTIVAGTAVTGAPGPGFNDGAVYVSGARMGTITP